MLPEFVNSRRCCFIESELTPNKRSKIRRGLLWAGIGCPVRPKERVLERVGSPTPPSVEIVSDE